MTFELRPDAPQADSSQQTDAADVSRLAFIRHELRGPLTQIIGYSDLLAEEAEEDPALARLLPDLERIGNAGKRMHELIGRYLGEQSDQTTLGQELEIDGALAPPISAVSLQPTSHPPGSRTRNVTGQTEVSLLVADDDATNRDLLTRRLVAQGYNVTTAPDGETALTLMQQQPFDLLLLDIMMPGVNGLEVLRRWHTDEALRQVPVIMISALDELDKVVECIQLGAEDYLLKPFNPTLLKARIGACLEKKRLRDREAHLYEQLRENYERLEALERWRDDWTNMIVHDLRTPLTSILGGLQTLEFAGPLNDMQREFVTIALRGAGTLLDIINDLLDVHKMEAGQLRLDMNVLAVKELIDTSLEQVLGLAREKELPIHVKIEPELPPLRGDVDKLRRVMVNLLGNAVKFTPRDGYISVEVRRMPDESAILLSIHDTGEGIPEEAVPNIFDKFGQVETRRAGRKMSTGLGLTFCKMIVEAHGGRIGAESQPECGSTFYFTLPTTQH